MRIRLAVCLALGALAAGAQDSTIVTGGMNGPSGTGHFLAPRWSMPVVRGAPYSAERVTALSRTLADGTLVSHGSLSTKVWRDSAGRIRTERPLYSARAAQGPSPPDAPMLVDIEDPPGGIRYVLDPVNKVAHRQQLAAQKPPAAQAGSGPPEATQRFIPPSDKGSATAPSVTYEDLGTQSMEGVIVEGLRQTVVSPPGTRGNDHPISHVTDKWESPALKVTVFQQQTDPEYGDSTDKLIHINRSEPDPALFQPPPDYSVVDEPGEFTIRWGRQE